MRASLALLGRSAWKGNYHSDIIVLFVVVLIPPNLVLSCFSSRYLCMSLTLNWDSRAKYCSVSFDMLSNFLPSSALQFVVLRNVLLRSDAKILAISQAYTRSSTPCFLYHHVSFLSTDVSVLRRGQQHSTDPSLLTSISLSLSFSHTH